MEKGAFTESTPFSMFSSLPGYRSCSFLFVDVFLGLCSRAKGGETNNTPELQLAYGVVIADAEQGLNMVPCILEENPKQWRWDPSLLLDP